MSTKIFLCDQPQFKTTHILKEYWENDKRFELVCDPYFNPIKAQWADYTWIEWCEGSIINASERVATEKDNWVKGLFNDFVDPSHKNPIDFTGEWKNTKIINRAIDIDVWFKQYPQVKWGNVNALVYIAKHIFNVMDSNMDFAKQYPNLKTVHIPLSIDLDKWTFKDRTETHGKNIAFVNHLWSGKGMPFALQIMRKLVDLDPEWHLWLVGDWSNEPWLMAYVKHNIAEMGLANNISMQGKVPDVNAFLDKMDYSLCTSYKEAFSLITAESMACGLKPVIHNWLGAKDIWDGKFIYNTIDEAVKIFLGDYNSQEYLEYVKRYDKKYEIEAVNNLFANLRS